MLRLTEIKVGDRVRLVKDISYFPDFIIKGNKTGTVVDIESAGNKTLFIKMDEIIPDLEEWDNVLQCLPDQFDIIENQRYDEANLTYRELEQL